MTTAISPVLRKPADAQHPIHRLIGERWSPRAFSGQPVERVAMIALGYPGSAHTLPDALRERELAPRTRKPLEEFVFDGKWEKPADEVAA